MNKEDIFISFYVQYTYNMYYTYTKQYYSTIKKELNNAICSNTLDLEIVILSEISQMEKDKFHMIVLKES